MSSAVARPSSRPASEVLSQTISNYQLIADLKEIVGAGHVLTGA
jgi:hypothetical protein